jgi:hypothetical protein
MKCRCITHCIEACISVRICITLLPSNVKYLSREVLRHATQHLGRPYNINPAPECFSTKQEVRQRGNSNMAPKIDPEILKALSLDAATTTIASHGGSDFASTFKITSKGTDGAEKLFFLKQGKGRESEVMFAGISRSLISNISI